MVVKNVKNGMTMKPQDILLFHSADNNGKNYETNFYRLEAILAVAYRVNATQAPVFRTWATQNKTEHQPQFGAE